MNSFNKQRTLAMMTGFERYTKKTRRAMFLEEMEQVVPCAGIERCASTHRLPNSKSTRKKTSKDEANIIIIMIIMRCHPDRNFHLCRYPVLPPCVFSIKI